MYNLRPTEFKAEDFVAVMDDPSLKELEKKRELSPNTKLRILQRRLELDRKEVQVIEPTQVLERPLPVFTGFKHGKNKGLIMSSTSGQAEEYKKKMRSYSANKNSRRQSANKIFGAPSNNAGSKELFSLNHNMTLGSGQ